VAFQILKEAITVALILTFLDISALLYIEANSSDFVTWAILLQVSKEDSKWYLVEHNYEIYNKKMLIIIYILEKWHHFLKDTLALVKIWIDHKNFKYFITAKNPN